MRKIPNNNTIKHNITEHIYIYFRHIYPTNLYPYMCVLVAYYAHVRYNTFCKSIWVSLDAYLCAV